jgi:hypothetical protein
MDSVEQPRQWKMDMRLEIWNIMSPYRGSVLKIVVRELVKYKLDLVAIQEVRWDSSGSEVADHCTFFVGNENVNHCLGTGFFIQKGIRLEVKRIKFISNRMPCIVLGGHWCDIVVNVQCIN